MNRLPLAVLLLAAALPSRAMKFKASDGDNVRQGDYVVEKGRTVEGDVAATGTVQIKGVVTGDCAAFGGPLIVEGECRGDAASFGGPVEVSGKVGGEAALFGGDLTLKPTAVVGGGVSIFGGKLKQENGSQIKGEIHNFGSKIIGSMVPNLALAAIRVERDEEPRKPRKALLGGFMVALCLLPFLLTLFVPRHVEAVAAAAASDFWRALGHGLLIEMAVVPATLALVVSILGIPFVPVAHAALAASFIMGMAAFFLLMARRACANLGKPEPATIAAVGYAGLATAGLSILGGLIPVVGGVVGLALFLTLCCGATLGLGAVWLTKMGTKPA